jgi:hypothetical protein
MRALLEKHGLSVDDVMMQYSLYNTYPVREELMRRQSAHG